MAKKIMKRRFKLNALIGIIFAVLIASLGVYLTFFSNAANCSGFVKGDINCSGKVDITDLSLLLSNYGKTVTAGTVADANNSGKIDISDLSIILSNYGSSTPAGSSDLLTYNPDKVAPLSGGTISDWAPGQPVPAGTGPIRINVPAGNNVFWGVPDVGKWGAAPNDPATWWPQNRDLIIKLPNTIRGPVVGLGGRNVRVIGGSLKAISDTQNCLFEWREMSGNGYAEGLLLDHASFFGDGIRFYGSIPNPGFYPGTKFPEIYLQNIRAQNLVGHYARDIPGAETHSDGFMTYGSMDSYHIDHMTVHGDYIGFMVHPGSSIRSTKTSEMRYTNTRNFNSGKPGDSPGIGGYYFVANDQDTKGAGTTSSAMYTGMQTPYPIKLYETYAEVVSPNQSLGGQIPGTSSAVFPPANPWLTQSGQDLKGFYDGTTRTMSWRSPMLIDGNVKEGIPAGGDFVPANKVGLNYVSPGYQQ